MRDRHVMLRLLVLPVAVWLWAAAVQGAEFHVSRGGDDGNPGTRDRPFATPAAARKAVRKLVAAGLTQDVRIVIAPGTYFVKDGLTFTPADSGTETHSITYVGAEAGRVVLFGGVAVTGFRKHPSTSSGQVSIYVADLPKGVPAASVLCENGVRMQLAREPNDTYGWAARGARRSAFQPAVVDIKPLEGIDVTDGMLNGWPGYQWFNVVWPLKRIGGGHITTTAGRLDKRGNRFYLMNLLPLLDQPGECVLQASTGKVYVRPRKGDPGKNTYYAATAKHLIHITGDKNKTVRNLHFEGLVLSGSTDDLVRTTFSADCSFRNSRMENSWQRGVHFDGHNRGMVLENCELRNIGQNGVTLRGPGSRDEINTANIVRNNHIHHCGRVFHHGVGVQMYFSGHNRIENNHIHHMGRYGVSIKAFSTRKTRRRDYAALTSRNNVVAFNHIHDTCTDSSDCGAIESWGTGKDNVLDHNLIHDSGAGGGIQFGIYLDDATDYTTVSNNILYGIRGGRISAGICAKGIGNVIDNNVLVVGSVRAAMRIKASVSSYDQTITHNIFYFESGAVLFDFYDWQSNRFKVCDSNVYSRGARNQGRGPGFGSVKGGKSIIGDPKFVDAAKRDFRLKPDSPALKIGIKSIDTGKIGLTKDYPGWLDRE